VGNASGVICACIEQGDYNTWQHLFLQQSAATQTGFLGYKPYLQFDMITNGSMQHQLVKVV